MNELVIDMLTPCTLQKPENGRLLLCTLSQDLEVLPFRYGPCEPLERRFDEGNPEDVLTDWESSSFFWYSRYPRIQGGVYKKYPQSQLHGSISVSGLPSQLTSLQTVRFLSSLSRQFVADFAAIDILTEPRIAFGRDAGTVTKLDRAGKYHAQIITTHILRRYLPDLYWGTVFGPTYTRLFGKDRLMTAPAPVVKELKPEMVYIQLSDSHLDTMTKPDEIESTRSRVKEHLNNGAFFNPALGPRHDYNVPQFTFFE